MSKKRMFNIFPNINEPQLSAIPPSAEDSTMNLFNTLEYSLGSN
jgi:hypothetical protein